MTMKNEFPFEKLPEFGAFPLPIFQRAVNEVIKVHKVPAKLAHYCALATAGALAQMLVDVEKPAGGTVPAGVYVLLQGKSGERKTTVDECFFGELRRPNKDQRKRHLEEVEAFKVRERIWKRKNKVLVDALAEAYSKGTDTRTIEASIFQNEEEKPEEPMDIKLVFNDVTIEALKNKLAHSPNATLLSSDGKKVLSGLLLQNDADLNKLWSGEEIDVERVTVPSYTLSGARFTFSVMIQNEALSRIMADKGRAGKESGFFARVIFSDVGSTIGDRLIDLIGTTVPDLATFNQRVAKLSADYIDAVADGSYRRKLLRFSAEASRAWVAYFNYVESHTRAGGRYELAGDHASKLADNVARVAAGLHVLEGGGEEIGMNCLLSAITLCDEASRDYMKHLAPKNEDETEALSLKDWLVEKYVRKRTTWVDLNKLLQFAPNRMRSARSIHRYLEILERDGCLVVWPPGIGRGKAQIELLMTRDGVPFSKVPGRYNGQSHWELGSDACQGIV